MKDDLSIKDFSNLSGIELTTLRYWDDIGLFSPERRDPSNGYRYYAPWQIIAVNFVTVLRNIGVPLKKISEVREKRNPENIMDLIDEQEYLLDKEIRRLQQARSIIQTRRNLIRLGQKADISQIAVEELPERAIILGPPNETFEEREGPSLAFIDFCKRADALRIDIDYPVGGYHTSMADYLQNPSRPERFFSADPSGNDLREAGEYLVAYTLGYYGEFGDLPHRMEAYAQEHGLIFTGPVYVIYLFDEISAEDSAHYLAQISVAVSRKQ